MRICRRHQNTHIVGACQIKIQPENPDESHTMKTILTTIALTLTLSTQAQPVIGISDGDTLTVLDAQTPVKIRISAIDAPEKGQDFGQAAKKALSDLCYGKNAQINPVNTDRYGRTVADVKCDGKDVGIEMVKQGMAWVYDRYAAGYGHLYRYQNQARYNRIGLWQTNATPPWEWRKQKRNQQNQLATTNPL